VIRVQQRDALMQQLEQSGIGTAIYYPVPFHRQECFASLELPRHAFPESDSAAQETLALPVYPEMSAEQLDYVATTVLEHAVASVPQ
jgi:dTDP-4-amino-4,6-dideoxygalactose transaminase